MKILVINGSPKGQYSTTLQTVLFIRESIRKKHPGIEFDFIDPGRHIRSFENDFSPAIQALENADVFLFSYPVYTFIAPYQLHRFIELMKESGVSFEGKIATQITTSKHFYDITAHRFIEENCADMQIKFVEGLSADMDDLLTAKGQKQATDFFEHFLWSAGKGYFRAISDRNGGIPSKDSNGPAFTLKSPGNSPKSASFKAIIVADFPPECNQGSEDNDGTYTGNAAALPAMVNRFKDIFPYECDVVNIREFPFKGGCMSCFNCATDGKCIYSDGFDEYLRNVIHKHDAIIYAFRIKDHSMGSRFKMYDDRQFCNGHRTVTMGTPFGYIIDGEYSKEDNLRLILEARAQVGGNFLAGAATSESAPEAGLQRLSDSICYALEHQLEPPQNFLGVGGMKIFRDLIYLMRGMMRADHRFFKSHGQYDFPQKKFGTSMKMYPVGWLMSNRKLKVKMGNKMNEGMIAPYKKVVDKAAE